MGHLQWNVMRKVTTVRENLYGAGTLGMGDTIFSWDGNNFTETECPKRGPWFGNFMRGSKLSICVIKRQDFGVILDVVKALLDGWEAEW